MKKNTNAIGQPIDIKAALEIAYNAGIFNLGTIPVNITKTKA